MSALIGRDKVKIGEYALRASIFDKSQDELQNKINLLQNKVNTYEAQLYDVTSRLEKSEEQRKDLE